MSKRISHRERIVQYFMQEPLPQAEDMLEIAIGIMKARRPVKVRKVKAVVPAAAQAKEV